VIREGIGFEWLAEASRVGLDLQDQLAVCWWEVANAGGAVGFPFLPVKRERVNTAVTELVDSLDPRGAQLLVAHESGLLLGWLLLTLNASPVVAHWARVSRVQTSLAARASGVGQALMAEVARAAREDHRLEQLHLELRAGQGLEGFYASCGWKEIGRWQGALRLAGGSDRDEVLMLLSL
jgi:GNAT superfamily N-acetyltransferase